MQMQTGLLLSSSASLKMDCRFCSLKKKKNLKTPKLPVPFAELQAKLTVTFQEICILVMCPSINELGGSEKDN